MSVIAGDIEGGGVLKQLGVMFTDWMFLRSCRQRSGGGYRFDVRRAGCPERHPHICSTRARRSIASVTLPASVPARRWDWLTVEQPEQLGSFSVLERARVMSFAEPAREPTAGRRPEPNTRAGDHLSARHHGFAPPRCARQQAWRRRPVWFDFFDLNWGESRRSAWASPRSRRRVAVRHVLRGPRRIPRTLRDRRYVSPTGASRSSPLADRLAKVVDEALAGHPDQPVRLLAPAWRAGEPAMIALHPDLWAPDRGAAGRPAGDARHLEPRLSTRWSETLLAKSDSMRKRRLIDIKHDMQEVLDIVSVCLRRRAASAPQRASTTAALRGRTTMAQPRGAVHAKRFRPLAWRPAWSTRTTFNDTQECSGTK